MKTKINEQQTVMRPHKPDAVHREQQQRGGTLEPYYPHPWTKVNFLSQAEPGLHWMNQIQDSNREWRRNIDGDLMTASIPNPSTDM